MCFFLAIMYKHLRGLEQRLTWIVSVSVNRRDVIRFRRTQNLFPVNLPECFSNNRGKRLRLGDFSICEWSVR